VQSVRRSVKKVNAFLRWLLRLEFRLRDMKQLQPNEPFDIRKHQLIPARSVMVRNLDAITDHHDEVERVEGRQIQLASGERVETDVLLWGTGYRMSLRYLGLPPFDEMQRLDQLTPRLGSLVRSIDYPDLFFVGMSLTESTSSTPFFAAVEARSIVSHILGECEIPLKNVPHLVAHWDLHRLFARFDHANYSPTWWKVKYFLLALWYGLRRNKPIDV